MSIFHKTCPECAVLNDMEASVCACGYRFDTGTTRNSRSALETIADEERLYLDYLAARVGQAQETARSARKVAETDPENHTKAADALFAEQALMTARGELAEQELRLRNAQLHIGQNKSFSRPRATPPAPKSPTVARGGVAPTAHLARSAAKKRVVAKPRLVTAPETAPTPTVAISGSPVTSAKIVEIRKEIAKPATVPIAPPTPAPKRPETSIAAKPAAVPLADRPSETFRATQAARARKVVESNQGTIPTPTAPVPISKPGPAALAASAAQVSRPATAPAPSPTKECPHCWGAVPASAARCRCGFEFTAGPELPGLTLSAAERALFLTLDFSSTPKSR